MRYQGDDSSRLGLLEELVAFAVDKHVIVLVLSLLLAAAGCWAFTTMHVDAVPDISNVQVTVTTSAHGLAPVEVEQYITYPVELSLQSLPRLVMQRSISKYALSQVTVIFEDGTDIYWARQQVSERLKHAQEQMPSTIPVSMTLGPIATGLGEVYQFEVVGPGRSQMELRQILDWQIIPALKTVRGVDEVQSMGGEAKEYQVWLHPERMHGYRVSAGQVMAVLSRNNANAGGGYTVEQNDQVLLRGEGLLRSTSDIGNVVIERLPHGGVVKVRDVADAVIGSKLPYSVVTHDGKGKTVIGIVVMRKGENSKEVSQSVAEKIAEIQHTLPSGVKIVPFYDRSWLIDRTVDTVWHNLTFGALLVLALLFIVMGSIRSGIIAALAIPFSLAGALLFLQSTGTSANLMSLGAIDFGILIDGSVVVMENIVCRLSESGGYASSKKKRLAVIKSAAQEVAAPVLFAVLIITVVYLPILSLPGVSGKTFLPMALTVIFALITALLIALFITPSLCYFILPGEKGPTRTTGGEAGVDLDREGDAGGKRDAHGDTQGEFRAERKAESESLFMRIVRRPYRYVLIWAVRHPFVLSAMSFVVFISGLACLPLLGSEFIPTLKEGSVVLTVNRPMSASLDTAAEQTTLIEHLVKQTPEVRSVVSRTGRSDIAFDPMGPDETDVFIIFKDRSQWRPHIMQQQLEDEISRRLQKAIPGIAILVSQPIEQRMNEMVAGAKGDVAVRILGPDMDELRSAGQRVAEVLKRIEGSSGIKIEQTSGLPVVTARLNNVALAGYGVSGQEALDTIAAARDGKVVGTIYEGKPRFDLSVRFEPQALGRGEDLASLPVAMTGGDLVPLGQLATITRHEGAAQISHRQGDRYFTVQVNVRNRDLGGYVEEAQKKVREEVQLPPGYRIEWGGQFENMKAAQERLVVLVPLALLLIFSLLYALFDSAKPGVLVFLNIPLAFSGGIFALLVRGMHLSVTAGVGFIALFGVAVMNGVVLVSTIRQLERTSGIKPRQAALLSAQRRLRPVLMTALVASFGFIPMAFADSVGAEVQRPLATVVIGGLITSTVLTLLVLPAVYARSSGGGRKRKKKKGSDQSGGIRHEPESTAVQ